MNNIGISARMLLQLCIEAFPPLWVAIAIGCTTAVNKLISKINEKKRWKLIADQSISQDNDKLIDENTRLRKDNKNKDAEIGRLKSKINRTKSIMEMNRDNMRGGIDICNE